MQATLIYNPHAGGNGKNSEGYRNSEIDNFKAVLREAGYEPNYVPTESEEDLDPILAEAEGLVVTAGGDGTARAVLTRLINRENVHFTPLPMGSANNVCRNLGIAGEPLDILRQLHSPRICKFDMGHLKAPWGEDYFVEGAGVGFFAEVLASYDPEKGKSVLRSLEAVAEILERGFCRQTIIELPDRTLEDGFLLVEVLNTDAVGPRLKFAPDADPTDGLLHVVCIKESQQEGLLHYLRGLLAGELHQLESVDVYKVPELKIHWGGFPVHADAKVHPPGFDFRQVDPVQGMNGLGAGIRPFPDVPYSATIDFRVIPQALSVWLPAAEEADN